MPDLGVRLRLLIGAEELRPAPYTVMESFVSLEARNTDRGRDTFDMTFTLGKDSLIDYGLLLNGFFDPPNRIVIAVLFGVLLETLIDGVITNHQVVPSNRPGESSLKITGEDISLMLDRKERSDTHPNQSDSVIVGNLLKNYAKYGIEPEVTPTSDTPSDVNRVPSQQGTDLAYINRLAQRNGFVFYIEPTVVPGRSRAFWGKDNRLGAPQPELSMNMGPETNIDSPVNFHFNALGPVTTEVTILDPFTKTPITIPAPSGFRPPLASRPAGSLRQTIARGVVNLDPVQAALRALSSATESSDAVTVSGQIDAVRYGRVLRARRLVKMRGVGGSYNGNYYVREVTHRIQRGEYEQSFKLTREGQGA